MSRVADFLRGIADRLSREPRTPGESRIPYFGRTPAGVSVTADNAMTLPVVWAATRYLSQTVAMLPWHVHLETEKGTELIWRHPVDWRVWKRPSPEWSSMQFRETLTHWALRYGNGYAEIERDIIGRAIALWPIHPDRVEVCRDVETGELVYEISNEAGPKVILPAMDVFHVRGFGDSPVGVNVMEYAARSIGWAMAAQLFGSTFFGNGMNVSGVVTMKKGMKGDGISRVRAEMENLYKGPRNANKTAILDADAEWKQVGIDPEKGQLIPVHQHLIEDVCRWFGAPPHKVAHLLRATFSNIEHQSIEVVQDSIQPWVKRFEDEADYKLFGRENRRGYFTKINLLGLQRGDFKSQAEGFRIYREMGVMNADEIRDRLDMNKQPNGVGEKYTMQGQYTTVERIGERTEGTQ